MHVLLRGHHIQKARLYSGLVLFAFALTHFLNHALGLIHIETMHEFQQIRWLVTRSSVGTVILASALVIHVALALWKLSQRKTFRLPPWEMLQLALGLLIPFLLFPHIVNTRIAHSYFGVEDNYLYELARLWPASAVIQSTLLLLVWIHGCIGIHFWLRLYSPYRAAFPILLFIAIAIPLAALAGFMVSGRAVARLIEDQEMLARVKELTRWPNAADGDKLAELRAMVRLGFAGALGLVALAIAIRTVRQITAPKISVRYVGGPTIKAVPGATLLEISRMNAIPHASVCGGRARCSTCRVRIDDTAEPLPPPQFPESVTLGSINAPDNVRLACQIRPTGTITVTRLLRPGSTGPQGADVQETDSAGIEKPLAVLYLNMRDFTLLSQKKLPYDTVFLLNEFFASTGGAIAAQGGWIDKFLGDGFIAIFGQRQGVEGGCRQALRAVRAIDLALDHVNAKLQSELVKPLQVGIGIHAGPLLLGRVGFGEGVDLTAIGPAVKIARALEGVAKEKGFQVVLSREVANLAGWTPPTDLVTSVSPPGAGGPIDVVGFLRGRDLPASILAAGKGGRNASGEPADDRVEA